VTRTALRLGFTSSVYLTRTEPTRRRRRRRRRFAGTAGPVHALLGKAFLEEQGLPLLPRVLACAAVVGAAAAGAAHVTPGRSLAPTVAWSLLAGLCLTAVATRFTDPVRLDVDRAPFAGAVPLSHQSIAWADIAVSGAVATVACLFGAVGAIAIGAAPAHDLVPFVIAATALGVLLSCAAVLGALSDDPSPLLPPAMALGYRTAGLIAVTASTTVVGFTLRQSSSTSRPSHQPRVVAASLLLLVPAILAGLAAAVRASRAITRGR
jgi:hypothetical protein